MEKIPAAEIIVPDWPVVSAVRACTTTRIGGSSEGAFEGFNLGNRAGDRPQNVRENRALLHRQMRLPAEPCWLWQLHSTRVVDVATPGADESADAAWTQTPGTVCAVMSADCLPVLFADRAGRCVAAAHAGWRGLLDGVLEAVVDALPVDPGQLMAWLGPAIGPAAFEVGADVRDPFCALDRDNASCFQATGKPGKWLANLPELARVHLRQLGITSFYGVDRCTYTEAEYFFSYRREGAKSGRMATLIWLEEPGCQSGDAR
jgi:YfiH family protein